MYADIVLTNGKVYSIMMDGRRIGGTAVAVRGDTIQAVGSDAEMQALIGPHTQVIDCKGHTILPGLCDSHCHPSMAANFLIACDLFGVSMAPEQSCDDIIEIYKERLRAYIATHPDDDVIRGAGWNLAFFNGSGGESRLPNRHDLDAVCRDRPIILESYCVHNLWANTKAIEMAGLDASTKAPASGIVQREEDGFPTGLFQEMAAMALVKEGIPGYDYSVEKYQETIREYQKSLANAYGVTLVNDCLHSDNAVEAYRRLAEAGELTLRARGVYHVTSEKSGQDLRDLQQARLAQEQESAGDCFGIYTVKIFIEGEMCMCEPWEPEVTELLGLPKDYKGTPLWTDEQTKEFAARVLAAGFQLHIHAMGDRSVKRAVAALAYAQEQNPGPHRNIIAHLMAVKPEDLETMGKMKTICALQPRWMLYDTDVEDFYTPYFGKERARRFYPNKRFLDAGCIVTYGTDFPVTPPPDPYHEIQCALTRTVFKDAPDYERFKGKALGAEGAECADCVTLDDAIKSLTINGAYQNGLEDVTGSLEAGKSADIVLLNADIESTPVEEIYAIKAALTLFKGKIVHTIA